MSTQVFIFRSETDRRQFAFTRDRAGANLPKELAPWHQSGGRTVPSAVGLPESVLGAIKAKGYVILQIERALSHARVRPPQHLLAAAFG
jgi:hypothetical protein